ncbi:MAG: hypothetical protein L6Q37_16100, partial [Bdellovibrionaceae bacterium]|nr:hypothetical protein [Pseudobdellovibrionaceae bacterium]
MIKGILGRDGANSWKGSAWAGAALSGGINQGVKNLQSNITSTAQNANKVFGDLFVNPLKSAQDWLSQYDNKVLFFIIATGLGMKGPDIDRWIGSVVENGIRGLQWASKGSTGALQWGSEGWDNAARTFNNATGQSKYGNGQSSWDRSDLGSEYTNIINQGEAAVEVIINSSTMGAIAHTIYQVAELGFSFVESIRILGYVSLPGVIIFVTTQACRQSGDCDVNYFQGQ